MAHELANVTNRYGLLARLKGTCSCGFVLDAAVDQADLYFLHGRHVGVAELREGPVEKRMEEMGMSPIEITSVWVDVKPGCQTIYVPDEMKRDEG